MNLENNFLDLIRKLKKRTSQKNVSVGENEIINLNKKIGNRVCSLAVKDDIVQQSKILLEGNYSNLKNNGHILKYFILWFAVLASFLVWGSGSFYSNKINFDIISPVIYEGKDRQEELWNLYYQKANLIYKDLVKENYEEKININFAEYIQKNISNNGSSFLWALLFLLIISLFGFLANIDWPKNNLVWIFERLFTNYKMIIKNNKNIANFFTFKNELKTLEENINKISINGGVNQYQNKKYTKSVNDIKEKIKSLEEELTKEWITNDDLLFYQFITGEEEEYKKIQIEYDYTIYNFFNSVWIGFIISYILLFISLTITSISNTSSLLKLEKINNVLKEDIINNKISKDILPSINFMVETKDLTQEQKENIILRNIELGREPYNLLKKSKESISKDLDDLELIDKKIKNIELLN